jgi:hypothetical protein
MDSIDSEWKTMCKNEIFLKDLFDCIYYFLAYIYDFIHYQRKERMKNMKALGFKNVYAQPQF